jgi:YD repeat-containing protein
MLNTLTRPNGSVTSYGYVDGLKRLTSVDNRTSANTLISKYAYGYSDALHKDARSFMENQVGTNALQHINYTYDDIEQLLGEASTEATPLLSQSYTYDRMGNRLSRTDKSRMVVGSPGNRTSYGPNVLNQVVQSNTVANNGNSSSTAYDYDQNGNLTRMQTSNSPYLQYVYDDADRLVQVIKKGSGGANQHLSEFLYDGQSRKRVSREYSWDTSVLPNAWKPDTGGETWRVYDGMDVVQERDGTNTITVKYVRDGNIGGLLSRTTVNGTATADFYDHYGGSSNVV